MSDSVLFIDDYDDDEDDYRNATNVHDMRGKSSSSGSGHYGPTPPNRTIVRRASVPARRRASSPIVRRDDGNLSVGKLLEAGSQILAAIQPLPSAPIATGKIEADVANMITYQTALAEHAKRDEQLRTIGQLASKLFA